MFVLHILEGWVIPTFRHAPTFPRNHSVFYKLAEESGNAATIKLAEACTLVNDAEYIAEDLNYVWGSDVRTSMINALMECAVSGTDIDSRFEQLQKELTALNRITNVL